MRIAALQLRIDDTESQHARIARVVALVRAQRGADLVVLPELWVPGAFAYSGYEESAGPVPGPLTAQMSDAAREIGAHVLLGTVIERAR